MTTGITIREGGMYRRADGLVAKCVDAIKAGDGLVYELKSDSDGSWWYRENGHCSGFPAGHGRHIVEEIHEMSRAEIGKPVPWKAPSDRATRKATPIYSGFIRYFPDAMAAVAQLSFSANAVHNPGEKLHWSKDKSNDHGDCIARHVADGLDNYDTEPDHDYHYLHAVKNAWRSMAYLQTLLENGKAPRVKKGEL